MKPMTYTELTAKLRAAGFTPTQGKGDHEKWSHPALTRPVIITQTREISPGVTRIALQAINQTKGQDNG